MNDLLQMIRDGEPVKKVLSTVANTAMPELERLRTIDDDEFTLLSVWATRSANVVGVAEALSLGCVLSIFRAASNTDSRRGVFTRTLGELRISKTQAYRTMAVWRRVGPRIVEEPELTHMFVPESLKLLCEEQTPDEALNEAIEMARSGLAVDIKTARGLRRAHAKTLGLDRDADLSPRALSSPAKPRREPESAGPKEEEGGVRQFTGRVVSLVLRFRSDPDSVDQKSIVDDILSFVEEIASGSPVRSRSLGSGGVS
ncbi:MAG: hypothetical protein AAFX06_21290 [Planctomycetota bacterium]